LIARLLFSQACWRDDRKTICRLKQRPKRSKVLADNWIRAGGIASIYQHPHFTEPLPRRIEVIAKVSGVPLHICLRPNTATHNADTTAFIVDDECKFSWHSVGLTCPSLPARKF
jgi:hypothetical protein